EAATACVVLSGIAISGTLRGHGPFVGGSPNESLLLLQAFMGVMAVTTTVLGALVSERRSVEETLRRTHDELELRVLLRTEDLSKAVETLHDEIVIRKA